MPVCNDDSVSDTPLIELDNVSVVREQTRILDRVSLTIPRFRHTAILGPNGSGKSSLLKVLMRHFYPSVESDGHQGTVSILGRSDWQVGLLRRRMGMVTAMLDHEFSDGRTGRMTVVEAVASGFTATQLKEFGPAIDDTIAPKIDQAIETVGMSDFKHRRLGTLSTGERRRTLIARAIVHDPDIFVLDEPTNGLDMAAKADFLGILDSITRRHSLTLVLVTHHVDEIPPAVNNVVLLDHGKVVFDGDTVEGLTSERISNLFQVAVNVAQRSDGWFDANIIPALSSQPATESRSV
ncbi:ATP-binding cassette domain-containing protein [Stieleria sp. TO1_6]|uniref:ABC transporter ATP-binding protein n=1 Tax=Stieleria tagensis TaxID=2956795 RepID=UPI00209B258E|nr:ATP-binding cassette domain-containing protein [Stieleria tagensis]MCO8121228.1 ATP-binding cassette domain-containing protein [Stieleria tagensis]